MITGTTTLTIEDGKINLEGSIIMSIFLREIIRCAIVHKEDVQTEEFDKEELLITLKYLKDRLYI